MDDATGQFQTADADPATQLRAVTSGDAFIAMVHTYDYQGSSTMMCTVGAGSEVTCTSGDQHDFYACWTYDGDTSVSQIWLGQTGGVGCKRVHLNFLP